MPTSREMAAFESSTMSAEHSPFQDGHSLIDADIAEIKALLTREDN